MHFTSASKLWVLALASGLFPLLASAQWQWLDKDGRQVFSDRSPPSDILEKNIVKRPGAAAARTPAVVASDTAASPAAAEATPGPLKISGKDPQLEAKKKQAEEAELGKKTLEEDAIAKLKADNCERAQKGLITIKSGVRIATVNGKGERDIMDDTARMVESKRLQRIVDTNCK